jgi:hypothetical protein
MQPTAATVFGLPGLEVSEVAAAAELGRSALVVIDNMDALARAVIHAFAFLELSDDTAIDPDCAVKAMEMLAADLQDCTAEEKAALERAVNAEHKAHLAGKATKDDLIFYKEFMTNLGLNGEE